ncbi:MULTISPECIES: ExbD/TolR family protein [unclassified Pseudomonas]|jgi:biopolymer transport protein ExbD|uniref:ExbD/TolR family protein n=1 Tax=unclassified Pseudomonas TaxID=196821 RepID=UPI000287F4D1|nr:MULTISPECIES: biopolymer transporter ExbD [unclassified Pseudomonas]QJI37895.1 biopolymer transporter ExbD [Pseudomonas sp. ADAK13]
MAGGLLDGDDLDEDGFNPEINTTPLVDVMLVLLVIFIITVPAIQHAVKIDLPKAVAQQDNKPPPSVDLALDSDGHLHWDDHAISDRDLPALIAEAAARQPVPELHLRAERNTPYEKVVQVMAAAQSGGLDKIGFVTQAVTP